LASVPGLPVAAHPEDGLLRDGLLARFRKFATNDDTREDRVGELALSGILVTAAALIRSGVPPRKRRALVDE